MRSHARPRTLAFGSDPGKSLPARSSRRAAARSARPPADSVGAMVGELPDFALEVYLGEWEFAAEHQCSFWNGAGKGAEG